MQQKNLKKKINNKNKNKKKIFWEMLHILIIAFVVVLFVPRKMTLNDCYDNGFKFDV